MHKYQVFMLKKVAGPSSFSNDISLESEVVGKSLHRQHYQQQQQQLSFLSCRGKFTEYEQYLTYSQK